MNIMGELALLSHLAEREISPDLAERLVPLIRRMEYPKGSLILGAGELSRYWYLVEKGLLRQFYYKNGRDVTEHFSAEGDLVVCIESLFGRKPTRLLVEAIEPAVVYLLEYDRWKRLCAEDPEAGGINVRLMERMLVVSQQKADSWRFESASERYERFLKDFPEAARRAPVSDIASYLLMTPETLSRIRGGK